MRKFFLALALAFGFAAMTMSGPAAACEGGNQCDDPPSYHVDSFFDVSGYAGQYGNFAGGADASGEERSTYSEGMSEGMSDVFVSMAGEGDGCEIDCTTLGWGAAASAMNWSGHAAGAFAADPSSSSVYGGGMSDSSGHASFGFNFGGGDD